MSVRERRRIIELGRQGRCAITLALNRVIDRGQIEDAELLPELLDRIIINQLELMLEAFLTPVNGSCQHPTIYDTVNDIIYAMDGDDVQDYIGEIARYVRKDDTHPVSELAKELFNNVHDDGVDELWNIDNDVLLAEVAYGLCPSDVIMNDTAHTIYAELKSDLPNDAEVYSVVISNRKVIVTYDVE